MFWILYAGRDEIMRWEFSYENFILAKWLCTQGIAQLQTTFEGKVLHCVLEQIS